MSISFSDRVAVPDGVLISNLQEESVILNLESERYFGLDSIGTRILTVLTTSESIEAAYEKLLQEYDVDGQELREDLIALVQDLAAKVVSAAGLPARTVTAGAPLAPTEAVTQYSLGLLYESEGDKAKAGEHYQRALTAFPNYPEAREGMQRVR